MCFICFCRITSHKRSQLDGKSEKCIFIGYSSQSKTYRLYNPLSGKIITSRNIVFDEEASWDWNEAMQPKIPSLDLIDLSPTETLPHSTSSESSPAITPNDCSTSSSSSEQTSSSYENETPPRKFRSLQDLYDSYAFALMATDLITYQDAAEQVVRQDAMKEELNAIEKNDTWELVKLLQGKKAIGLKWIFRTKFCADGSIQKHKARLVVKRYTQQQGVDFEETFSPIAQLEIVRTFLALAAQLKWLVYQFDVKSVFLNEDLVDEVYVTQPEGFVIDGQEEKVLQLKKVLYGLKQTPRAWYNKIGSYFLEEGFKRSDNEPTLYLKREGINDFLWSAFILMI